MKDTSSPWSGDDSDHQRAGMGMGIGVDPGPETCSNKKPRLGSMPETASLGVDPGNAACLKHEHVTHTCYDTDGSSNIGISMCDNFHKRRRPVPTATPGTKKQRGTNHRIPWGHALAHMKISDLEFLTRGNRHIWTDLVHDNEDAHQKFGHQWCLHTSDGIHEARQHMRDLFSPWGVDKWRCVNNFTSDKQFLRMPLWDGGRCWEDFCGDARPDMPPPTSEMGVCDLYLTDYDPHFWKQCFPAWCNQQHMNHGPAQARSIDGMGVDTGHGSAWLSWRATHVYEVITALAGNCLMTCDDEPAANIGDSRQGVQGDIDPTNVGVCTTQCWMDAVRGAIPIIWEGVGVRVKMVLLTMVPGGSQQELGTVIKYRPQETKGCCVA